MYIFCPLDESFSSLEINVENIISFTIEGEENRKLNSFRSVEEAYNYLQFKRDFLKYINFERKEDYYDGEFYEIELHLKNRQYHRIGGHAKTEIKYKSGFLKQKTILYVRKSYCIDGKLFDEKDYYKHEKVREAKLKRILKNTEKK